MLPPPRWETGPCPSLGPSTCQRAGEGKERATHPDGLTGVTDPQGWGRREVPAHVPLFPAVVLPWRGHPEGPRAAALPTRRAGAKRAGRGPQIFWRSTELGISMANACHYLPGPVGSLTAARGPQLLKDGKGRERTLFQRAKCLFQDDEKAV